MKQVRPPGDHLGLYLLIVAVGDNSRADGMAARRGGGGVGAAAVAAAGAAAAGEPLMTGALFGRGPPPHPSSSRVLRSPSHLWDREIAKRTKKSKKTPRVHAHDKVLRLFGSCRHVTEKEAFCLFFSIYNESLS